MFASMSARIALETGGVCAVSAMGVGVVTLLLIARDTSMFSFFAVPAGALLASAHSGRK